MDSDRTTVHVVDDDASVRRSLRRLLRSSGYAVQEHDSAEEFLLKERPTGAGCLILDVRMPRIDGLELFERLANTGDPLPVIFLTGHGDVPTSVRAIKQGAVDFLLKPVDAGTLLSAIEGATARHAASLERGQVAAALESRLRRLTPREREVMEHVVGGEPNKCIAIALGISEKTVKVHRHWVMKKMGAGSLPELVHLADAARQPVSIYGTPPRVPPTRTSRSSVG